MTQPNGTPEPSAPVTELREHWAATIGDLTEPEAKAALLQAVIDIDEHQRLDHVGGGIEESGAVAQDEYLASLIGRSRLRLRESAEQATSDPLLLGCAGTIVILILVALMAVILWITEFTLGLLIPMALVGTVVFATVLWFRARGRR